MLRANFFVLLVGLYAGAVMGQEAEPAKEQAEAVSSEATQPEKAKEKTPNYDLSLLPDDLRQKVEKYLNDQASVEKEIKRLDSMVKASSNQWAQQRATGMATKLNYELKQLRLQRRDIIRDYRELLRSGWEPPAGMGDFENLFFSKS